MKKLSINRLRRQSLGAGSHPESGYAVSLKLFNFASQSRRMVSTWRKLTPSRLAKPQLRKPKLMESFNLSRD